jgi:hypothetical protein
MADMAKPPSKPTGSGRSGRARPATKGTGTSPAKRTTGGSPPARRPPASAPVERRRGGAWRWILALIGGVLILGGFYLWQLHQARRPAAAPTFLSPAPALAPKDLPGLQTGPTPWTIASADLRGRLEADHLPVLSAEATTVHFHLHLDVFVAGQELTVPANLGINQGAGYISPIHTHDETGIIHVESPDDRPYTLGQLFDIWGVRFTTDCVGGLCTAGDRALRVYVGGKLIRTDPRLLQLSLHQEIVVTYGTSQQLPDPIPSTYGFPVGS